MNIQFIGDLEDSCKKIVVSALNSIEQAYPSSLSISINHLPQYKLPNAEYRVLILLEPKVVLPWQYNKNNWKMFNLVIPINPWRAKSLGIPIDIMQPYGGSFKFRSTDEERNIRAVMINANKFSALPSSNYGIRREVIRQLSREDNFMLFGENWNKGFIWEVRKRSISLRDSIVARKTPSIKEAFSGLGRKYRSYKGSISEKGLAYQSSKLSIVIENESDCVTEKLFDSLQFGCVPIYIGANFSFNYPKLEDCIFRAERDATSVIDIFNGVTSLEISDKASKIAEFISNVHNFNPWDPDFVWKQIAETIKRKIEKSSSQF